jgi:NAD(P)-dependent dehydrogenase (short-subunit alcohol dehydrogenase family)
VTPARPFEGKVALVTGASRGVGAATAVALAAAGCRVACAARSTEANPHRTPGTLEATIAAIEAAGGTGVAVPTNLADRDEVRWMVESTVGTLGRLDILVNNAAVTFVGDVDVPERRYDLIFEINLHAPFVACREALPHLRAAGEGRILNVSSVAALHAYPGLMAYGMTKIALERMTLDLAAQLQPENIAVNCFRIDIPVASEGFLANMPDADHSDWEPPEVAAEGILWMLSQPISYSGWRESMNVLRDREGIMASRAARRHVTAPITELQNGIDQ